MNLVEKYVYNITSEKKIEYLGTTFYEIICDTDCYGNKEKQRKLILSGYEYKMVKQKGYYLA